MPLGYLPRLLVFCRHNRSTVERDVLDCLRDTELPVLVVGPGSAAALAAIADSAAEGFTHIVTMRAACGHSGRDIRRLAAVSEAHPLDVVAAARYKVRPPTAPPSTPPGRRLHGVFGPEIDSLLRISQSDLRIYPLIPLQDVHALTGRVDGETELLIRLLWKDAAIRIVETGSEREPGVRPHRFRRLTDDVRAGILAFVLVTVALLRKHHTPAELSSSLGVGVFIGCTPFFGFHTLLAMAVSFLCGLNVGYVWFGTQISNPVFAAFLTVLSVRVGRYVIHSSAPTLGALSVEWLVGSVLVGSALAVLTGVTSYCVARTLSREI